MFGQEMVLVSALRFVLPPLLLLMFSRLLWEFRWSVSRDRAWKLPLPHGSMGWPLVGETFHWLFQGSSFHISRREKHGYVFKTHLLGKPVIRVTGAENIRKILLGEHTLVSTQWPQSTRIILGPNTLVNSTGLFYLLLFSQILAKAFSRGALEGYLGRIQDIVKGEIAKWCTESGPVDVYAASKALTFRVAVQVLGLHLDEQSNTFLSETFEQLMNNLFSLPIDTPISGRASRLLFGLHFALLSRLFLLAGQHDDRKTVITDSPSPQLRAVITA